MKFKIQALRADSLNLPLEGDPAATATALAGLGIADRDCLTFYTGDQPEVLAGIAAGIVLADAKIAHSAEFAASAVVWSETPMLDFVRVVNRNHRNTFTGHSPIALPADAKIACNAYVEASVELGSGAEIYPFAALFDGVKIGAGCRVQSFSSIGTVGLGYAQDSDGVYAERFTHLGGVEIGDDVDIGANTTIVRGILQNTRIGSGTKIGNQVNVGHNVTVGKNCFISAGAILCGSVLVEDGCWLAPGCRILNKVTIRKNTQIGLGAVVSKDTEPDSLYLGSPARRVGPRKR